MANESLISIPPDLSDETILRRTLSSIVETLDIAIGNKLGVDSVFTRQSELIDEVLGLQSSGSDVETLTSQLLAAVNSIDELSDSVEAIEEPVNSLVENTYYGRVSLDFTVADNTITVNSSKNVENPNLVSEGVYTFDIIDNDSRFVYYVSNKNVQVTENNNTITITVDNPEGNITILGLYVPD